MRARGIAQAAALVTGLTAGSAILGFLRDVVIAGVFGAGANLDAYLVSQGVGESRAGADRRRHGESDRPRPRRANRRGSRRLEQDEPRCR